MRYSQFVIAMACFFATFPPSDTTDDSKLLNLARQNLIKREKEYLKTKPLSSELSAFISRFKKSASRDKRDDDNRDMKKNMYVVNNGEVVPIDEVSNAGADPEATRHGNFTVVPLVIPIILEQNVTDIPDRLTPSNAYGGPNEDRDEPRTEDAETQCTTEAEERERYRDRDREPEPEAREYAPPPPRAAKMDDLKEKLDSYQRAPNKAKKSRLLDKILKDVEQLAEEQDLRKLERMEGALCSLKGDWESEAGGVGISVTEERGGGPTVALAQKEPPAEEGFLKTGTWQLVAQIPFNHSSVITITAVSDDEKKVATFIGECRTCQEMETITGAWLVGRLSKDCQDQKAAHQLIDDVFRRNNVRKLQEEHLRLMTSTPGMTEGSSCASSP